MSVIATISSVHSVGDTKVLTLSDWLGEKNSRRSC